MLRQMFATVLMCASATVYACWPLTERKEIDGFAEMDGVLILSFKNAVNCEVLADASVFIGEMEYKTDARGYVTLPMAPFTEMMDASAPLKVVKTGYITLNTELVVAAGTVLNRKQVLTPALPPGQFRFVLQWESVPEDLDLHLKGPDFHISYRNMKHAPNRAKLDRDEMFGYGPETITLDRITPGADYSLWVDVYSRDDVLRGSEEVFVYAGEQLVQKIRLPSTRKRGVHVLDIRQGQVMLVNQPSERP